ncbi:MAG: exonuclease SbcCD subunit D [Egibacteraceae bacterium]
MRLLHTSDWHLGRTFHGAPLLAQQVAALEAMVDLVRSEAVDVVLVAGDLFDRQLPPVDAVETLSEAFAELRGAGARVVAISGNHDSGRRLAYGSRLLAQAGVSVCGDPRGAGQPVLVEATDGGGDLAVYPIPYLEPEIARHHLSAPGAAPRACGHEAVLRLALDRARADAASRPASRTVAVAHAFAAGGQPSDSERTLAVGGSALVPLRCFDGFDYVALGHLHGRQVLGEGRVRYSGSPVPYSFSERGQRKSVEIIDLAPDGTVRAEPAPLPEGRRLAAVHGTFDDLLASSAHAHAEDCWVQATVTDPVLPRDAMARLRQRFPHAVVLLHEPPATGAPALSYRERTRGLDDLDLACRFVAEMTGTPPSTAERRDLVAAIT